MICKNCNKEIADGSKFCEFCGAPQDAQPATQPAQQPVEQANAQQGMYGAAQPQQNANSFNQGQPQQFNQQQFGGGGQFQQRQPMDPKVKKFIAAVVALIVIIGGIAFGYNKIHKEKVDVTKYIKIECEGYDGKGTATYRLDDEKFAKAILKAMGKSEKDMDKLMDGDEKKYEDLFECIQKMKFEFDEDSKLSNGDEIKLTIEYDNDLVKDYGIKFTGSEMKYKVKDLKKVKEIDPFADVTVEFTGTSPKCYASVKNNSSEEALQYVYYDLDKSTNLKEGDEVTVSFTYNEDTFVERYGVVFTSTEKKFKVENVDKYIMSSEEIDETFLAEMQKQVGDVINAYLAGESSGIAAKDGIHYEGYYLLTNKNDGSYDYPNKILIVYSATIHNKENDGKKKKDSDYDEDAFKDTKVYFPVELNTLTKYADGTSYVDYKYLDKYDIKGLTDLVYNYRNVKGYTSLDLLKNELVDAELATYEYTGTGAFAAK